MITDFKLSDKSFCELAKSTSQGHKHHLNYSKYQEDKRKGSGARDFTLGAALREIRALEARAEAGVGEAAELPLVPFRYSR